MIITAVSFALSSCGKALPTASQKTEEAAKALLTQTKSSFIPITPPSSTPTETSTPHPSPIITFKSSETITPSPEFSEFDVLNKNIVETSRKGDEVVLENVLIKYIVKLPRPGFSDAVYGILAIVTDEGDKGVAVIENFDCEFDALTESSELGDPLFSETQPLSSGIWQPSVRFEILEGEVFVESSMGTVPIITSEEFKYQEETIICEKTSVFEGFGDLPEKAAEKVGQLLRELVDGFEERFFEDNN